MKKAILFTLIFPILIIINDTSAALPMPASQEFYQYCPIVYPVASDDPAQAKPVGVGIVATGGDIVSINVNTEQFSAPVDIYFGIYAPLIDPNNVYLLWSYSLHPVPEGLAPWKQNVIGPVNESLFGDIPISLLPNGPYYIYFVITPTGNLDNYYFWSTYFEISTSSITIPSSNVKIWRKPPVPHIYHSIIQAAYDDPALLDGDIIQCQDLVFNENVKFDFNVSVTLEGGYDPNFTSNLGYTIISGTITGLPTLTITNGTVKVENIIIQ